MKDVTISLKTLFALSKTVQIKHGWLSEQETDWSYVQFLLYCGVEECIEAVQEIGQKPWKQAVNVDREELADELADIVWFTLAACIHAGISADELSKSLAKKYERNIKRAGQV